MSDKPRQPDRYGILEIDKSCSTEDIRARRRQLSRQFHPSGSEPNEAKIREINEACDFLEDPEKRKQYDRGLEVDAAIEEHEAKVDEAREERARGPRDTKAFGERIRDQAAGASSTADRPPPPRRPPPRPSSGLRPPPRRPSPPRPPAKIPRSPGSEAGVVLALDELPPIDWGGVRAIGARLVALVAALALLALPFGIVAAVGEANEYGLVLLGCFALFVVGLAAVAFAVGAIFTRD